MNLLAYQKQHMKRNRRMKQDRIIVLLCSIFFTTMPYANPVVDNVAAGNVAIQQTSNSTTINQSSQKAIINWQSFNIGQSESTHFQQPAGGITLNRISAAQGPSSIYGNLTANGRIILINPAGIFFGSTAYVNVGGLIATTSNITDQNFLNGNYHFDGISPYSGASIINEGQIIAADHGLVALVASNVVNHGLIQANLGHVVLASGNAFTVNFDGSNLINFTLDQPPSGTTAGITNTGSLIANGGEILVTAKTAQNVLDHIIDMQGFVQAQSVAQQNGEIILSGDPQGGVVHVAANIDVSGQGKGQMGGQVAITGYDILIDSPTTINASGDSGGGNIFIGGNAHGAGPLPNANATVMLPNASLIADAITSGNGGNVVLWSNYVTKDYGTISARGGADSGNGGFVETSSHNYLDVNGALVDTRATNGQMGTWLLDPTDVTISSSTDSNATYTSGTGYYQPTNGALASSTINVTNLENDLATTNVTVTTTPVSGSGGSGNGDITVANAITWSSSNSLTLSASHNIYLNADITATNGSLDLSATNASQSITSGSEASPSSTGVTANISVENFNLVQGQWYQSNSTLPTFSISNNFQINSGTIPNATTQFLRVTGGAGTSGSPYQITDVYGLQGMGSNSTLVADSYKLVNNIDASGTSTWNNNGGFEPLGNSGTKFSGSLNGQGYAINTLTINFPSTARDEGLFGYLSGSISNTVFNNPTITGYTGNTQSTGTAAGAATGSFTNIYVNNTTVTAGGGSVGGLVGNDVGSVSQSYVTGTLTVTGTGNIGGFIGVTSGNTIQDSFSSVVVTANSATHPGAFVGSNQGATITHDYATGDVIGGSGAGGFVGSNSSGTVTSSYFDSQTTGRSSSSAGTAETTTNMMTQSTFSGWDFTSTWSILAGQSYPYLQSVFSSTPRVVSGSSPAAGDHTVKLAANGSSVDSTYTGNNGFFYFIEKNGTITDNADVLVYLTGSTLGNAVAIAPSSGGSLSGTTNGLAISTNSVTVGENSGNSTLSNSALSTAKGSLSDSAILYSVSGGNLTLISGDSLTATSGTTYSLDGNVTATSANLTFNGPMSLASSATLTTATSGDITVAGTVTGNNDNLTFSTAGSNSVISGSLSGLNSLTSSGAGTLILSASNTYTGSTTLSAGTLEANNATNPFGTGTLNLNGGTLSAINQATTLGNSSFAVGSNDAVTIGGNENITFSNSGSLGSGSTLTITNTGTTTFNGLSGSGALTENASGSTVSIAGSNSGYAGTLTFTKGTLQIANDNTDPLGTGTLIFNGGTLSASVAATSNPVVNAYTLQGSDTTIGGSNSLTLSGNGTLNSGYNIIITNTGTTTLSGNLSGAGGLDLNGSSSSTLVISGADNSALTGNTLLFAGMLQIGTATNALGKGGTLAFFGTGTDILQANVAATLANPLEIGNSKTAVIGGSNNITLSGTARFDNSAGVLEFTNTGATTLSGVIGGGGSVLENASGGTVTLSGANTYTGGTTLTAGTLVLGTSSAGNITNGPVGTSTLTLNGGTLQGSSGVTVNNAFTIAGNVTIGGTNSFTLGGAGTLNSGDTLTISNSGTTTLSGVLSSAGAISQSTGTLVLSAANTYTGGTTINSGTTIASNNNSLGTGALTVNSGGELEVKNASIGNSLTLKGTGISNTGALVGVGSSTVSGNISLGADTTIATNSSSDALNITGTINGADNLTLAGSGTITLQGIVGGSTSPLTLTSNAGSTMINTSSVTTSGAQTYNDAVTLNTNATLTGSTLTFNNGVNGNKNLNLNANTINLSGALTLANVTIAGTGNSENNTFTLNTSNNQNWTFNAANTGTLNNLSGIGGNFTFSNIQNIVGGNANNTFIFANGSSLSGSLNGGSLSATNILNYANYSDVTMTLSHNIYAGSVSGNNLSYTNINKLVGNNNDSIVLPNKTNTVVITGTNQGYINDPVYFSGINHLQSQSGNDQLSFTVPYTRTGNNGVIINGTLMTFSNFNLSSIPASNTTNIATVIQQSVFNPSSINMITNVLLPPWLSTSNAIEKNIDTIIKQLIDEDNKVLKIG